MATVKLYDLCVSVGSYTDRTGQQKNKWKTVGAMMQTDKGQGGNFLLLDRDFNPSGIPHDASKGNSILVSMFEPKKDDPRGGGGQSAEAPAKKPQGAATGDSVFTDDIPF
jgi:hypothetical protein